MLHGRVVRSPYPSARIVRLDTRAAAALSGVVAVLTARDVPRNELRVELPGRMAAATAGAVLATQPVLADARVRFQGEPVAAIAAETPEAAAAAADLVAVEYEELPGVYDPLAALAPDAPRVHDTGNLLRSWYLGSGDVNQGFARADVVVEHTYRTPFVDHVYMETETGIGWIDAEGVLVLRVSTQVLEHYRDVAEILRLPHSRVRLEGAYVGGGFGGKEDVTVECLLGLLVWKTRRPVQLVFSREESFIGHGKRHPYIMRYRSGATREGTLTALEAELISDSGAYATRSPRVRFWRRTRCWWRRCAGRGPDSASAGHPVLRRASGEPSPPRSRPTAACAGRVIRRVPGSAWSSTAPRSSAAPRRTSAAARPRRCARSPPRSSASSSSRWPQSDATATSRREPARPRPRASS